MIRIKNLSKSYGKNQILKNISLNVEKEEVLALIGFSGSGKSTLLKLIAGLEHPNSGTIDFSSEKLSMTFQYSALFDSMTVKENLAFALRNRKPPLNKKDTDKLISEKLRLVGLSGTEDQFPSELSGGMKKRVGFARAIIDDPDIILYDEPTAGLDPVSSTMIEDLIVDLQKETKAASIVVTHQKSTILRTATKVAMLYNKELVWQGSPEELYDTKSTNEYAIQFQRGQVDGPMTVKV